MNPPSSRDGFSLMEVLMATSILLASVIVLGELAGIGRRQASAARELATAQILCENKLNEILAGAARWAEVDDEPIEEHSGWMYSVEIEPRPRTEPAGPPGLVALKVTVAPEESQRRRLETEHHAAKEFSLVRWARQPAGSSADGPRFLTTDVARPAHRTGG